MKSEIKLHNLQCTQTVSSWCLSLKCNIFHITPLPPFLTRYYWKKTNTWNTYLQKYWTSHGISTDVSKKNKNNKRQYLYRLSLIVQPHRTGHKVMTLKSLKKVTKKESEEVIPDLVTTTGYVFAETLHWRSPGYHWGTAQFMYPRCSHKTKLAGANLLDLTSHRKKNCDEKQCIWMNFK